MHLFLLFSSNFPLLDPDLGGKINADPDPQPCKKQASFAKPNTNKKKLPELIIDAAAGGKFSTDCVRDLAPYRPACPSQVAICLRKELENINQK